MNRLTTFLLTAAISFAQVDFSGRWTGLYHEDELERTDPGPSVGDNLGLPIMMPVGCGAIAGMPGSSA